ncbi:GAF domain-containing protein [Amycolatopsis xylanica]|uniref:GAF domain-containing protein n=1 Tax=Amycolatopsis xylanica TaxID=589385 RepID=UPI0015A3ACFE|nr:GAF domain-containing protein [Amycolatopsis xylanica]
MTDRAEDLNEVARPSARLSSDALSGLLDRAALSQAAGVLVARYGLPDSEVATRGLIIAARRHDRDPRALARALLVAPEPRWDARSWFAGRVWRSAPPLDFLRGSGPTRPLAVLDAALAAATDYAQTGLGDIQTVSLGRGGLDLRHARGFSTEFVQRFAHVEGEATACAIALKTRRPVAVPDVTTCDIFDDPAVETLVTASVRTVESTPILAEARCAGVFSVHYPRPGSSPSRITRRALASIADQAGAWLHWYDRTAMLDALEDLHQHAGRFPDD